MIGSISLKPSYPWFHYPPRPPVQYNHLEAHFKTSVYSTTNSAGDRDVVAPDISLTQVGREAEISRTNSLNFLTVTHSKEVELSGTYSIKLRNEELESALVF